MNANTSPTAVPVGLYGLLARIRLSGLGFGLRRVEQSSTAKRRGKARRQSPERLTVRSPHVQAEGCNARCRLQPRQHWTETHLCALPQHPL